MRNIDLFNLFTAAIFVRLYENFPRPVGLSADDIAEKVLGEEQSWEPNIARRVSGEEGARQRTSAHMTYSSIALDTINWLQQCDYVRIGAEEDYQRGGKQFVLSPKSLEVLSAIPESLGAKVSLADKLDKAIKEGGKEAGRAAISKTIGEFMGAAVRGFIGTP